MEVHHQHSLKLIQCLSRLEGEETKTLAKMELMSITSELMPGGKPKFLEVVKYPAIAKLATLYGKKTIRKALYLMVKDLCSSLNIAHNMNEDQVIEAAAMLLDECDNFRLEDYQMMFALAKRGQLVEFKHQLDISVIGNMLDEYYKRRAFAAEQHRIEEQKAEKQRFEQMSVPKIETGEGEFTFSDVLQKFTEWQKENGEQVEAGLMSERYKAQQQWAINASAAGVDIESVRKEFEGVVLPKIEPQKTKI